MDLLKLQLLTTVILTQAVSLYSGNVPYFPIEISRTAASSKWALFVFRVGMCSSIVLVHHALNYNQILAWFSLVVIAIFDDVAWPGMHIVGLWMLGLSGVIAAYYSEQGLTLISIAGYVTLVRLMMRGLAILALEGLEEKEVSFNPSLDRTIVVKCIRLFERSSYIMKTGDADEYVLWFFRMSGVLQWVTFLVLSKLY